MLGRLPKSFRIRFLSVNENVMAQHLCQGTQIGKWATAAGAMCTGCRREPRFRNTAGRRACVMVSIGSQPLT
jgi:hypothetical protein